MAVGVSVMTSVDVDVEEGAGMEVYVPVTVRVGLDVVVRVLVTVRVGVRVGVRVVLLTASMATRSGSPKAAFTGLNKRHWAVYRPGVEGAASFTYTS